MLTSVKDIRRACRRISPGLIPWIDFDSTSSEATWLGDLKNGKAVEVLTLCTLFSYAAERQFAPEIPQILKIKPELMYLRNQLPLTYGSKPGHSGDELSLDIAERFLVCFVPKFVFNAAGQSYALFREGVPAMDLLMYIESGQLSRLRADIILVPGQFETRLERGLVEVSWTCKDFSFRCLVRALDAPDPSIVDFEILGEVPDVRILVECSVAKTSARIASQISAYSKSLKVGSKTGTVYSHLRGAPQHILDRDLNLSRILAEDNSSKDQELYSFYSWLDERFIH